MQELFSGFGDISNIVERVSFGLAPLPCALQVEDVVPFAVSNGAGCGDTLSTHVKNKQRRPASVRRPGRGDGAVGGMTDNRWGAAYRLLL